MFGITREELLEDGERVWSRFLQEDMPGLRASIDDVVPSHKDWDYTWRVCPRENEIIWVRGQSKHFATLPDGSIIRFRCMYGCQP